MLNRTLFLMLAAALCGCAPELPDEPAPGPCCADDGEPCTEQACVDGACVTTWATPGAACDGGFCDSDGVCRESCPREPCFDAHVEPGAGCIYARRLNGWTCNAENGAMGTCQEGFCAPSTCVRNVECGTAHDCIMPVCIDGECNFLDMTDPTVERPIDEETGLPLFKNCLR